MIAKIIIMEYELLQWAQPLFFMHWKEIREIIFSWDTNIHKNKLCFTEINSTSQK